jgi:hypothetical protein
MKEIVVTNGLRVRSEGIAVTVTASMLLTTASGYLALTPLSTIFQLYHGDQF